MEIVRNIRRLITCVLLMTSCFPRFGVTVDWRNQQNTWRNSNICGNVCYSESLRECIKNLSFAKGEENTQILQTSDTQLYVSKEDDDFHTGPYKCLLQVAFGCPADIYNPKKPLCRKRCKQIKRCCNQWKENKHVSATQNDSEPFDTSLLFFVLGLVVGLVTLTLVCVCCPATHKKATSLMNAAKRRRNETKGDKSVPRMTLGAARGQEAIPSLATADMTGNQENVYNEPDFYNELNSACDSRKYNTSRSLPSVPGVKGSGHNHLNTVAANVSGNSSKQVNSKFNNPDIHVSIPSHSICQCHAYQPFIPSRNYTENYSVFQLDGCSDPNVKSKFDTPVPDTMPAEEPHDFFVLEATSYRVSEKFPVPGHDKSNTENAGLGPDKSNTETTGSGPDKSNTETAGNGPDKSNTETAGSGPDKSNTETAGNGPDKSNTGTAGSKITGSESK